MKKFFCIMFLLAAITRGKPSNNVAEGKSSSQSSTYAEYRNGEYIHATSDIAVDGIWESKMWRHNYKMSCSHTAAGSSEDHWWMVNLEQTYRICKVVILNRGDDCCWDRLRHLTITVGGKPDLMSLCNEYAGPGGSGENVTIICRTPLFGQYVRISKPVVTEALQLCEVAVYPLH